MTGAGYGWTPRGLWQWVFRRFAFRCHRKYGICCYNYIRRDKILRGIIMKFRWLAMSLILASGVACAQGQTPPPAKKSTMPTQTPAGTTATKPAAAAASTTSTPTATRPPNIIEEIAARERFGHQCGNGTCQTVGRDAHRKQNGFHGSIAEGGRRRRDGLGRIQTQCA